MEIRFQGPDTRFSLRASALILQDDQLLVAKSDLADCYYTLGGGVRLGESTEEAVLRECHEETGLDWEIERLAYVQERFYGTGDLQQHEIVFFYLMKPHALPICNGQTTDQPNEKLYWLPLDRLHALPLVPSFLKEGVQSLPQRVEHVIDYE